MDFISPFLIKRPNKLCTLVRLVLYFFFFFCVNIYYGIKLCSTLFKMSNYFIPIVCVDLNRYSTVPVESKYDNHVLKLVQR